MTQEVLKLALDALETELSIDWTNNDEFNASAEKMHKAIAAIKEALAQPEQEPVAWMNDNTPSGIFARHMEGAKNFNCTISLYTAPQQRTWVGLTDKELQPIADEYRILFGGWVKDFARVIEAKLKEKNT